MRSTDVVVIVALLAAALPAAVVPSRSEAETMSEGQSSEGQSDFDFLFGRWKVHNRRLRERLKECTTWDEFEGTLVVRPVWGGKANLDEYEADGPSGHIQALTLRLFNPRSKQWSIHWATSANGTVDTPMIGSFKNGGGEFYDQEMFEGRSIYVRFIWSGITPTSCRWEQAFSVDGGKTWETNWTMELSRFGPGATEKTCCPTVELRQYTMKPGRRDELIALFDEHFLEGQEKDGMRVIGQFTDRKRPDRFVWMRGFAGMEARRRALEAFYGGPIWATHRTAANDTMADSSDVLVLKPARPGSGVRLDLSDRPGPSAPLTPGGLVIATIYHFDAPVDARFVDFFEASIAPALAGAGATLQGSFVTEASENTFPRLPVRQGENVFVWLASFADEAGYAAHQARLMDDRRWSGSLAPALASWLSKPPEVLELVPTRRSSLRHQPGELSRDPL
jgi:hypothetical protein